MNTRAAVLEFSDAAVSEVNRERAVIGRIVGGYVHSQDL